MSVRYLPVCSRDLISMTNMRDTMIITRAAAIIRIRMLGMVMLTSGVSPG
jgi:hypothetical protein